MILSHKTHEPILGRGQRGITSWKQHLSERHRHPDVGVLLATEPLAARTGLGEAAAVFKGEEAGLGVVCPCSPRLLPRLSGGSHFLLAHWAPAMRAAAVCRYVPLCLSLARYLCLSRSLRFLHLSTLWPQGIAQCVLMFVD